MGLQTRLPGTIFKVMLENWVRIDLYVGFPGGASGKEPTCQLRRCKRCWFNPWVGKIPGEGNGNPLQYSCLENPMDRGAWRATIHETAESDTTEVTKHTQTSMQSCTGRAVVLWKSWMLELGQVDWITTIACSETLCIFIWWPTFAYTDFLPAFFFEFNTFELKS